MDVWTLYLSSHNGKQPRNAFDLVNFSRTTDHTLTFKKAKQIYQANIKIERETNMDHTNGDQYLNANHHHPIDSEEDEPSILKSPKHIKKRKASLFRNNSTNHSSNSRRNSSSRRNSKASRHSKSTSRDSYKMSNYATKLHEDEIINESEAINYELDTSRDRAISTRERTTQPQVHIDIPREEDKDEEDEDGGQGTDSDSESDEDNEYDIYKRQRRRKNQSSPISLNIGSRHQYSHSQEQNKRRRHSRTRNHKPPTNTKSTTHNLRNGTGTATGRYKKTKSEIYRVARLAPNKKKRKIKIVKRKKRNAKYVANKPMMHSPRYIERQKKAKLAAVSPASSASSSTSVSAASHTSSSSSSSYHDDSSRSSSSSSSSSSATHDSDTSSSASSSGKSDRESEYKLRLRPISKSTDTRPRSRHRRHTRSDRYKTNHNDKSAAAARNKMMSDNGKTQKRKSTMQSVQISVPKPHKSNLKASKTTTLLAKDKLTIKRHKEKKERNSKSVRVTTNINEFEKKRKHSHRHHHHKHKHKHRNKHHRSHHRNKDNERERAKEDDYSKFTRSSSADRRTIPYDRDDIDIDTIKRKRKVLKPRPVRVRHLSASPQKAKEKEKVYKKAAVNNEAMVYKAPQTQMKKEKEKHFKFRVGDVVLVSLQLDSNLKEDLARIRYYGSTILDASCSMFGIECFKFQSNVHHINGCRVSDGSINGGDKLFEVKKIGYGTFIDAQQIKSHKCLWNLKKSKHALKLSEFDADMFVAAAKYGSLKVIKHLLRILMKINTKKESRTQSTRTRSRSRSNSKNLYYEEDIETIQTGFGYAVLNNHTKIVKMILTHFGSNNTSFNPTNSNLAINKNKTKKKTKSMTDFMIRNGMRRVNNNKLPSMRNRGSSGGSSVSSVTDSDFDDEYDPDEEDETEATHDQNNQFNISKFYSSDLFDLVCEQKNFQMLQILIEYDSWPLLSPSSRGLYRIFSLNGYLKWIKYLLEISPYIINMPLLSSQLHSTMMCTAIQHHRFDYTQYILSNFGTKLQQLRADVPWPLLLVAVMNLNANNLMSHRAADLIQSLLSYAPHQVNWCPQHSLRQQRHLFGTQEIFDLIDAHYCDHQLTYYNQSKPQTQLIVGSILAAVIYKSVTIYRKMNKKKENNLKEVVHSLSDMFSTFMLYGIDFDSKNEFQHMWMTYDAHSFRWNLSNFPYNVCHTKEELLFLQKMFKKALKKYPIKLLNCCEMILIESHNYSDASDAIDKYQLIEIFKKYIIPYSIYDALIFESLHFCAPNQSDQELSEPESVEFMFAYQRSPVVD